MARTETSPQRSDLVDDGFADVNEAAAYLGLARSSVYKLMDSGALRYAKFGKSRRVPWRALREYARSCLIGAGK
jgi:excisionase family DNA binding protein